MLLITREADYALRILRTLSEGGLVTAAEITQRELIPRQFAYKIGPVDKKKNWAEETLPQPT